MFDEDAVRVTSSAGITRQFSHELTRMNAQCTKIPINDNYIDVSTAAEQFFIPASDITQQHTTSPPRVGHDVYNN